jgi:hypothetical protein
VTARRYQRLHPDSTGPDICLVHHLLNYVRLEAAIDAKKLRDTAEPGQPNSVAEARYCDETQVWHIYIPTRGRMKAIRKQMRAAGLLPPEGFDALLAASSLGAPHVIATIAEGPPIPPEMQERLDRAAQYPETDQSG